MFMRFTGGGIGHLSTRESTREFEDEIRGLWGTATVSAHDSDDSEDDGQSDDRPQPAASVNPNLEDHVFDPEDAFVSSEQETSLDEDEGWYTDSDEESDEAENVQGDDGQCLEDESNLGYERF
jgi:hypothetical protein